MLQAALRPTAVMIYEKKPKGCRQKVVRAQSLENLKDKYKGEGMSQSARERVKRTIANWSVGVLASQRLWQKKGERKRRYFVMITLTLPGKQIESDEEVKRKYLNGWLQKLKREHGELHYLWVAETQKNGNIHFHVVVDRWVDFRWVAHSWNESLACGSYIDDFERKFGHRQPPSTKVTGQKKMKDPALYITKYVSKVEGRRAVNGHCWYCDDVLKELERVGLKCGGRVEDELLENFRASLKNVYYGERSTAYYFTEPIAANGVLDFLLYCHRSDICSKWGGLFCELYECIGDDLPLDIFPDVEE